MVSIKDLGYHRSSMKKRVAYQGITGSFSSIAAQAICGADIIPLQTTRFREIFEHVTSGRADVGVVAIENALAGSIHESYDLLSEYNCSIIAEYYCPVQLHLMVAKGAETSLGLISQVFSHPKALEQCSVFLEQHPHISPIVYSDTAGAALHVSSLGTGSAAAIASVEAAQEYGLEIVAPSIQNHTSNMTRFFAVAANPEHNSEPTKCSLLVTLLHQPASLHKLLGEFASVGVNVTKIESRPIPGKPFEYSFHIDLEDTPLSKGGLRLASERAATAASQVRVLGFYSTITK
jgi:prephenate dehydratase